MRLIDADALIRAHIVDNANDDAEVISRYDVNCAPTVDAVEVVHGHWITHNPDNPFTIYGECSHCGFEQSFSDKYNYCPSCGAKMDEVSE